MASVALVAVYGPPVDGGHGAGVEVGVGVVVDVGVEVDVDVGVGVGNPEQAAGTPK